MYFRITTLGMPLFPFSPIRVSGMEQKLSYRLICSGEECFLVVMCGRRPEARAA